MSKKKDAAQVFDEIITSGEEIIVSGKNILSCLEVLIKAAKELKEIFFIPTQAALPEKAAPTQLPDKAAVPEKTYSFEDVRGIMAGLSGQGKKAEARALLQKYGVTRLSDLAEKDYAALAEEAQVIANG